MTHTNQDLAATYDAAYRGGSSNFYTFDYFPESLLVFNLLPPLRGKRVLEIGCGEGRLACMMGMAGAGEVVGVDFSKEAVDIARSRYHLDNVAFHAADYRGFKGRYDVIVLQGVLEHMDAPFETLRELMEEWLQPDGVLVTSSPNFLNPRGYVWMTLKLLFNVPMSLTDIHSLSAPDFEAFAQEHGYGLVIRSTDYDWAAGERTLVDFRKRLRNALADAGMDNSRVDSLLEWMRTAMPYFEHTECTGVNAAYRFTRTETAPGA